jgi:hypothetical protein
MRKTMLAILAVTVLSGAYLLMNRSESINRTEDVYSYVPTTDGKVIPRDFIQEEKELVKRLLAQNYYGEQVNAGNWRWVDVVNINPVVHSNGHRYFAYGKTCGVGRSDYGDGHVVEGGTIRVRGEANGKVLYEYTARGNPIGTPCPSGILFFGERC